MSEFKSRLDIQHKNCRIFLSFDFILYIIVTMDKCVGHYKTKANKR